MNTAEYGKLCVAEPPSIPRHLFTSPNAAVIKTHQTLPHSVILVSRVSPDLIRDLCARDTSAKREFHVLIIVIL